MKTKCLLFTLLGLTLSAQAQEMQTHSHSEHTQHSHNTDAPIGLMGTHLHSQGQSMFSVRMMSMQMSQLLQGTQPVESSEEFHHLPSAMQMSMAMLGYMYAPNDHFTLMAMVPGHLMHMQHTPQMQMQATGLGDITFSTLLGLGNWESHQLLGQMGLSLPTGQIDIQDKAAILPYAMRLGSGTWDLHPGLTYTGQHQTFSWGVQPTAVLRLGSNTLGYRLGNRFQVNTWSAWQCLPWLSSSLRIQWQYWGNVDGADQRLSQEAHMNPVADPQRQSGQRVNLLWGASIRGQGHDWQAHRWGLEVGLPVFQSLAGPQLGESWQGHLGWEWQF